MKTTDMEATAPPVDAIEALRRNLLYSLCGISTADMDAIRDKLVEDAKGEDLKARVAARRQIMDLLTAPSGGSQTIHQQAIIFDRPGKETPHLSDARRNMVLMLLAEGPMPTEKIAKVFSMTYNQAAGALDHDWFYKEGGKWHVTPEGRMDVAPALEGPK